jgi:uncharacterized membrane protein YdjX (TVP38/TMEM64 family)
MEIFIGLIGLFVGLFIQYFIMKAAINNSYLKEIKDNLEEINKMMMKIEIEKLKKKIS